jgi:predicted dehydrogenase
MNKAIGRRSFAKNTLFASAGLMLPHSKVLGANEAIRIAVVGMRWKGGEHVNQFRKVKTVRVAALCDVDQEILDRETKKFTDDNERVDRYKDVRKLLEDKSIDAIVIATPNHWHSLLTIWACQAGKDVYVEKPVSHDIWEGRKMVEAARKYKRIVQAGTQRRSDEGLKQIREFLDQEKLGKIMYARGICYVQRPSIGKVEGAQPVPPSVDYDLWCGPAPLAPILRRQFHYDWHWFWANGNGEIGNNGIHFLDVCRWMLGQKSLPPRVLSFGGRLGYLDDAETPNSLVVYYDYQPAPIIFEVRGLPHKSGENVMDHYRGIRAGVVIHCEGGYVAGSYAYDPSGKKIRQFTLDEGENHHLNFLEAVKSRNAGQLNAEIEEGHLSSALPHLANISYRLGQPATGGDILRALNRNTELADSFERFQEYLLLNEVRVSQTPRCLGPWLSMVSQAERFTGEFSEKANSLLRRDYRPPYVVPEQI